jgi:hypothetical protein
MILVQTNLVQEAPMETIQMQTQMIQTRVQVAAAGAQVVRILPEDVIQPYTQRQWQP